LELLDEKRQEKINAAVDTQNARLMQQYKCGTIGVEDPEYVSEKLEGIDEEEMKKINKVKQASNGMG
jgi:hypothetical protein